MQDNNLIHFSAGVTVHSLKTASWRLCLLPGNYQNITDVCWGPHKPLYAEMLLLVCLPFQITTTRKSPHLYVGLMEVNTVVTLGWRVTMVLKRAESDFKEGHVPLSSLVKQVLQISERIQKRAESHYQRRKWDMHPYYKQKSFFQTASPTNWALGHPPLLKVYVLNLIQ